MQIQAVQEKLAAYSADTLLIFVPEGDFSPELQTLDAATGSIISQLQADGDFTGNAEETAVLYTQGKIPAKRLVLVGTGDTETFDAEVARRAAAAGILQARKLNLKHVTTTVQSGLSSVESAQAIAEACLLALYQYHGQKSSDAPDVLPEQLDIVHKDENTVKDIAAGVETGEAFAAGTIFARDLVNLPANYCTPAYMAEQAQQLADNSDLSCKVLEKQQMLALKMGALLGVAQGSDTPPRFIILEHNADKADDLDTIVLVGKGVTFDTGGYSLKSKDGMVTMKGDMGGGAAVLGAMKTVSLLKPDAHVVGLVPAADNMVSGSAYRPQDVLTASNGTTIEIISTDAEGRLLLADALVYAQRYTPAAVVDIATLTGGAVVALGNAASALFTTDDTLCEKLTSAGESTRERVWHMPLFPEYEKMLESQTADTKNSAGRAASACTAATFLNNFVDYPWAHVDMAGKNTLEGIAYVPPKIASGYGSRLLAKFVLDWQSD